MNLPAYLTQDSDGYIHVINHRVGIQDIVHFYNEAYSAEMLLGQFPTLSLSLIYKTIAFYLDNQAEVDAYLAKCDADIERQRGIAPKGPDLVELRRRLQTTVPAEGA
jgi:uncharacterized protein (DUF433 family)